MSMELLEVARWVSLTLGVLGLLVFAAAYAHSGLGWTRREEASRAGRRLREARVPRERRQP